MNPGDSDNGLMATEEAASSLHVTIDQIEEAIAASKCHPCGCFQQTVEALADTEDGQRELGVVLAKARSTFVARKYDCLGCPVCYPAVAANAFAEVYPAAAGVDLCPRGT